MTVPARGNQTAGGQWIKPTRKLAGGDAPTANRTATATLAQFNLEDANSIDAELTLAGLAGGASPSVAFKLQCSQDGTTWYDAWPNALPALTANGTQRATFIANGVYGRWVVTVTGGPTTANVTIDHQAVTGSM